MSALLVLIQLAGAWLRWTSFSKETTRKKNILVWSALIGWSVVSFCIYNWLFESHGIRAATYKGALMLGWIPYLAIFVYIVRGGILRHVFVFNMSAMWSFLQHNWSSIIVVLFFIEGWTEEEIIFVHALLYLILFTVLLPVEKYIFLRIWLPDGFFISKPQAVYIAFLPLVILMAHIIRLADDVLVHSWAERFSRIYLPFIFIFFYKYVSEMTKSFYRQQRIEKLERRLLEKSAELKDFNNFMQDIQKSVSIMRHDLRHSYRLIYALLKEGNVAKAREYLITQELLLESAVVRPFCKSSIISNALSVYFLRAEESGTEIFQRISIPDEFKTDENDLAILLASLLGNSVRASDLQAKGRRKISIIILHEDGKFILEILLRLDVILEFDEDGLPIVYEVEYAVSKEELKKFVEKYDAYVDFSQFDGQLKISMYWDDQFNKNLKAK